MENNGAIADVSNCDAACFTGASHSMGYPDTAAAAAAARQAGYSDTVDLQAGYSDTVVRECEDCQILSMDNSSFSIGVEMNNDLIQPQRPYNAPVVELDSSLLNRVTTYVDIHSPFPISGDVESHH